MSTPRRQNNIRAQLMAQTFFFALIFAVFASIAVWQIISFTQLYVKTASRNASIMHASRQAILSAKQMDWLIQRVLLGQYRSNITQIISLQGELLETMADFEMFIKALNWGSESPSFKHAQNGAFYKRWKEHGWEKKILLDSLPDDIRQYAGTAHLYYSAFIRYTNAVITHTQGNLNAIAEGNSSEAERHLALANAANIKAERFEALGTETLAQLINLTHQLNTSSLETLQDRLRTALTLVCLSAVLLLIFLFIVHHVFFTNLIAKPLEKLTHRVQEMDIHALNLSMPETGSREIESLVSKFQELLSRLRQTTVNRDALVHEIQQHKLTTEKLQQSHQELAFKKEELTALLIDLKRSNEELRQAQMGLVEAAKMESVGRLAAGVAHEVKNPLFIIQMGVDYLRKLPEIQQTNPVGVSILNDVSSAVERANIIIKGLLNFSTPHELSMKASHLNEIIEEALLFLKHLLSSHHTQIIKNLDPGLPKMFLDNQKMQQVFINLFMNSVQAMPATGSIFVSTIYKPPSWSDAQEDIDGVAVIEVMDTGTGFTAKSLERAFDPFYTTNKTGQGTGLGLSVTRKIIQLHGGMIALQNRPEGGAKIVIKIPNYKEASVCKKEKS